MFHSERTNRMEQLIQKDQYGTFIYEIVDEIPLGYMIWNIGSHAPAGYLPLCRPAAYQPFHGSRNIDTDALKAIRVDGAEDILAAVGYGPDTFQEMERYIHRYGNTKTDRIQHRVALYRKAISIMRTIKGIERLKKW